MLVGKVCGVSVYWSELGGVGRMNEDSISVNGQNLVEGEERLKMLQSALGRDVEEVIS